MGSLSYTRGRDSEGSLAINNSHIFATNTTRDNYFVSNPSELVSNMYITVGGVLQKYSDSTWVDSSAIVKGQDGTNGTNAPLVVYNYSVDGLVDWTSDLNVATHKFWRWSVDGGVTWTPVAPDKASFSLDAGMTPQQVTDLSNCLTDKHTHANKTVLDLTTAEYTTSEKTKLGNLTDNFKGLFANATARNTAVTNPTSGNYILQEDTGTVWYHNGTSWLNTGVAAAGDMLRSVYDPTSKQADSFSMGSMVETTEKKVMTSLERYNLSMYRGHVTSGEMGGLATPIAGNYCTRVDTKSVWLYTDGEWVDTKGLTLAYGDTKFSYKTTDHDGWIKLDGRSVQVGLTGSQKTRAEALGWTVSLPDTRGLFPIAADGTKVSGSVGGSNTIARSALPNNTLSGNTGSQSANHTHTTASYTIAENTNSQYATGSSTYPNVAAFSSARTLVSDNGDALGADSGDINSYICLDGADRVLLNADTLHNHSMIVNIPSKTSGNESANHTHAFTTTSMNGGVAQVAHIPAYSAKTEFVYLGE